VHVPEQSLEVEIGCQYVDKDIIWPFSEQDPEVLFTVNVSMYIIIKQFTILYF